MVELSSGNRVYVYPRSIDFINKTTTYTKAARALIDVFYTGEQLLQLKTLKNVEPIIQEAIIGNFLSFYLHNSQ